MPTEQETLNATLPDPTANPQGTTGSAPAYPICIDQTYAEIAADIARALTAHPGKLYLMDGSYGTVIIDATNQKYRFHPIDPDRIVTWLEEQSICFFYTPGRKPRPTKDNPNPQPTPRRTSLSPAQAKIVLASDSVRFSTPEIKEICPLRLPIAARAKDGTHRFYPAPLGYDPLTKLYTIDFLPIDWAPHLAWPAEKALRALTHVFKDFPLDGGAVPILQSRSFSAIITAMLGQFLRHNISLFPMIAVNANQPGTGKSFCVQAMLAPFHGIISAGNYLEDDNEMRKSLNAAIMEGQTIFFLDDIATLAGRVLPRYITMRSIRDRILGKSATFEKENRMQFFVTGNGLKTSKDIERRVLPIDLFIAGDAPSHTSTLTDLKEDHFSNPLWRADLLRALWSLCLHWVKKGCPNAATPMSSFKTFTTLAANIAMAAGLADPLGPRLVDLDTGDTMTIALIEFLSIVADTIQPPADDPARPHTGLTESLKLDDLVARAREHDLLETITNASRDPRAALSKMMRKQKGRRYTDSYGRQFQIGNAMRTAAARTVHPFHILTEPTRNVEITTPFDN